MADSKNEIVSSTAIPQCMPMPMAAAPVIHYVGYLNHPIDDRYMSVPPLDTNIHLHGFEGPADQENVFLSTLSTPVHACEYHITVPRTQPPGTYFYHPHVHGASGVQVGSGLSGAWIVEPEGPQLARVVEHVIMLRYRLPIRLDNLFAPDGDPIVDAAAAHEGAMKVAHRVPYDPFDPPPWPLSYPMSAGGVVLAANGCDGISSEPLLSLNGSDAPVSLDIPAGETQLLRVVNATPDSPKTLQLQDSAGRSEPLLVVAFDGVPISGDAEHPLARYISMNHVLLASSARADILLTGALGQTLTLSSGHFCEGKDAFFQMHHDLLRIRAITSAGGHAGAITSSRAQIDDTPAAKLVAFARVHPYHIRRRAITFTEYAFPKIGKIPLRFAYYITDTTDRRFREHPFWPVYPAGRIVPSNPDIIVKAGTVEEWYLINTTMEAHEFHIHQMSFVEEKSPAGVPLMVDVAFVPVGKLLPNPADPNYPLVRPSITKILLDFRRVPRGTFVFHCHMLFHEDHGMMAIVRIE
ncbi:MAG: multicopper oxidase family protein [Burkholderiales bacterium]